MDDKYKRNLTFFNLYKEVYKENPFFNRKKFEVRIALVCAIIFTVIFLIVYNTSTIVDFNEMIHTSTIYISTALIGMLGFVVGGLAIISGTIGNKVADKMVSKNVFDELIVSA